MTLKVAHLNM